jgi:hypothetical protein
MKGTDTVLFELQPESVISIAEGALEGIVKLANPTSPRGDVTAQHGFVQNGATHNSALWGDILFDN